ncbi:MAG: glycoside hydrolase family 3 C-terminal domain-containing protein [Lachnospiraceae bacterium]|nr:glycoside hydrolase family 3 C-terminal domain-containing protein [Lachnospiraceae bacterium]
MRNRKKWLSILLAASMMLSHGTALAAEQAIPETPVLYQDETYGDYYELKGLVFCDNPVSELQYLNMYIPVGYVLKDAEGNVTGYDKEAVINGFTVDTAPVIFRNNCAGWMSSNPENMRETANGFKDYMENGFIYVVSGARSRGLEGNVGKAPAPIVDLKAAIRYLRAHADELPGDYDRIVSVGGSGAGEMSSLVGATGNMEEYFPYLYEIGAAGITYDEKSDSYTSTINDDVYACMAYYPIADIENADIAYAWLRCNTEEVEVTGMQKAVFTEFQFALQQDEAEAYVDYLNSLELVDENGEPLVLDGLREGSFYDRILANMSDALNAFLADKPEKDTAAYAEKLMATNTEELTWLTCSEDGVYTITDLDGFIQNAGNEGDESTIGQIFKRNKNIPGFDTFNLGAENNAFGNAEQNAVHYSASVAKVLQENYEKYSALEGFNKEEVDQYIEDALTGENAEAIQEQTYLMNATHIMLNVARGEETSDIAQKWRIRSGTADQHTSFSIGYNMALAASYNEGVDVDYHLVWAMTHGGEKEGASTGTFVEWVNDLFGADAASNGDAQKYTETQTKDGWIQVLQDGGATLGYSEGTKLIEADGYVFKDLDKDGELDLYEDWRLDVETRAADLASKLDAETIMPLMLHGDLSNVEADSSDAGIRGKDFKFSDLVKSGMRSALNRGVGSIDARIFAKWINNVQALAEELPMGIPVNISANPSLQYSEALALAATFDPELVKESFAEYAKMYRAIGVTTLLGPQADMSSEPRWNRIPGTFGEDPALIRDMINASVSGLQSTFDEEGNDLGWGKDSVIAMIKHFPGDGTGESGRESHSESGKYAVYPGDGFEISLIPFIDGGLNLDSKTEQSAAVMTSYSIAYSEDEEYGDLVGTAFSQYKLDILRNRFNYDGLICSDWFILDDYVAGSGKLATPWGMEDKTTAERFAAAIEAGLDQVGGVNEAPLMETYAILVDDLGEEAALARVQDSARRILKPLFAIGLFENPYVEADAAREIVGGRKFDTTKAEVQANSVVMLKNKDNTIQEKATNEKLTVYIPMKFTPAGRGTVASWGLPVNEKTASKYFTIVTDTVGEPSGENGTFTTNDIIRASAEDVAACDMALLIVSQPINEGAESTGFGHDYYTGEYFPISLQYGEYVADGDNVRYESISGNLTESEVGSPYGAITTLTKEDRSYFGATARVTNGYELDLIKNTVANMKEDAKVIVAVNATYPMIFAEFEEDVDAILMGFSIDATNFIPVVMGEVEPSGLLPIQMPASMDAVEAQLEDIPRDAECYVDSEGHTYDFGYGLNWSGVISDERVAAYTVEPLTGLQAEK